MYISLIIILVIAIIAVIFGVQNTAVVTINFLGLKFDSSLALVLLLSVLIGFVITVLFSIPYFYKNKKNIARFKKEIETLKKERDDLKSEIEKIQPKKTEGIESGNIESSDN